MSFDQKLDAAKHKDTPVEMLAALAEDNEWIIRFHVSANESTPDEMLAVLAEDDYYMVRFGVVKNENTPTRILTVLAEDENWGVRVNVASNHSTDPEVLISLSDDIHRKVSHLAQCNPSLPLWKIKEVANASSYKDRLSVAENPSLPYENLLLMLSDRSKVVRERATMALHRRNESAKANKEEAG